MVGKPVDEGGTSTLGTLQEIVGDSFDLGGPEGAGDELDLDVAINVYGRDVLDLYL